MAYCTLNDILDNIDEAELIRITDDADDGAVNEDVVDQAIAGADALVDSYLAARHSVPMDPVPDIVSSLSCDIALYKICARRGRVAETYRTRYEDAVNFLKDAAAGKAVISGASAAASSSSKDHAQITGSTRIFTRDKLGGF